MEYKRRWNNKTLHRDAQRRSDPTHGSIVDLVDAIPVACDSPLHLTSHANEWGAAHGSIRGRLKLHDWNLLDSSRVHRKRSRKIVWIVRFVRLMEAFNLKFVGEVEKYPELYNYTLQAYSKRDAIEKAWNKVAKEVNLSVNECKEKWRNLRSTFVRHLKPKLSGSGATKKKPYYLMDAMQFVVPFVKVVTTSTADVDDTDNPEEENQDIKEETLSEPGVCLRFAPSPVLISTPPSANQGDRVATPPSEATIETRGPHGQPIRRRKFVHSDTTDKAFTAYFSEKSAKLSNPLPPKDIGDRREEGIKNFLMSLIPDLMQLNDVQLRSYKRRALLLIDEIGGSSTDFPQSSLNVPMGGNLSRLNRPEKTTPQEHSHFTENCTTVHQSL